MKLGATPKQVALLAAILIFGAIAHFMGGDDRPPATSTKSTTTSPPPPISGSAGPRPVITPTAAKGSNSPRPNSKNRSSQEFKPVLRPRRVEDQIGRAHV